MIHATPAIARLCYYFYEVPCVCLQAYKFAKKLVCDVCFSQFLKFLTFFSNCEKPLMLSVYKVRF